MRDVTLCFLMDEKGQDRRILLGMKKRGFGVNKWNGFGGKVEEGEEIPEAACREVFEEIGVIIPKEDLSKVGEIQFYFPHKNEWDQRVHVFFAGKWKGNPQESDEMKPGWFKLEEIPYSEMWVDDGYWLPLVLEGKKINAKFVFQPDNDSIIEHQIDEIGGDRIANDENLRDEPSPQTCL